MRIEGAGFPVVSGFGPRRGIAAKLLNGTEVGLVALMHLTEGTPIVSARYARYFLKTLILKTKTNLVVRGIPSLFALGFSLRLSAADDRGAAIRYEEADAEHHGRISLKEFLSSVNNKKNWWPSG